MKYPSGILLALISVCYARYADGSSLLQAQSFPKTAADLTFVQRVELLSDGFEVLESTYDASGRCISGCAYYGITLAEDIQRSEQNTEDASQHMYDLGYQTGEDGGFVKQTEDVQAQQSATTQPNVVVNYTPRCFPVKTDIPAGQREPVGEPLKGKPRITSPYGYREHPITGEYKKHYGIDFGVPAGTSVFTPADGVVEAVWSDKYCGNGIRIRHPSGYKTIYCHLSQQLVKQGETVFAGCEIAKTGKTGMADGAHLHYSIKYNDKYIDPMKWLGRN